MQILLQLKGAGLVTSTRGAAGGYQLLQPPEEISLGSLLSIIDGPPETSFTSVTGDSPAVRALADTWREVAEAQQELLNSISLSDLLERARKNSENMYYI